MFGLLASLLAGNNQRKAYLGDAALYEQRAAAARTLGKTKRGDIERTAAANLELDAENLRRAQGNKRGALSARKAQEGGSGFTLDSGSKRVAEESRQDALDREIDNMARSAAISYANMFQQGVDTERSAELQAIGYEGQAAQARAAARSMKRGLAYQAILGIAGGALDAYGAVQSNREMEADIARHADWTTEQQEAYRKKHYTSPLLRFGQGADYGGSIGSLFNPFTSALNADNNNRKNNWGWLSSVALGQVPYRVKEAQSPYGFGL